MKVRLKCQMDNGKTVLPPETETEMSRDQAMKLADMGMVEIIPDEVPAKPVKASTATKAAGGKPKKEKAAGSKTKKGQVATPDDEGGSTAEDPDNDSGETDDENQDAENDSDDSDDVIPDPDSLVE